jgi:hypothetical protein
LNQEDINYLNKFISSNEIEAVIDSQQRKAQDQMGSLPNSTRPLTLTPMLLKLFHKIEKEDMLSLYENSITLLPKWDKVTIKKKIID